MFKRVLIANRGEIALRIIRACRELGVETVCVYSSADNGGPWLEQADRAICIGPGDGFSLHGSGGSVVHYCGDVCYRTSGSAR